MLQELGCRLDFIARKVWMTLAGVIGGSRDDQSGQGTVEYAILVGVLVVIAIFAVVGFRDQIQALWDTISEGINEL